MGQWKTYCRKRRGIVVIHAMLSSSSLGPRNLHGMVSAQDKYLCEILGPTLVFQFPLTDSGRQVYKLGNPKYGILKELFPLQSLSTFPID